MLDLMAQFTPRITFSDIFLEHPHPSGTIHQNYVSSQVFLTKLLSHFADAAINLPFDARGAWRILPCSRARAGLLAPLWISWRTTVAALGMPKP
jgi:hypothetical protein